MTDLLGREFWLSIATKACFWVTWVSRFLRWHFGSYAIVMAKTCPNGIHYVS